ncbi:hypothetical protein DUNSADRAFT_9849 [Dunaliella salina]|uniref:Encoded protein n=1 Tax=Dunaliella salina TaxID=3046 RepID=A0ABQ7FSH4_DUNSA|nr:hypothetical protein DUNSADRAFT_9849 [Dunaliella salina]|eukprot:KAF5825444.1 hypothetical protein DUNSADRAFT_9849 [Dunaliella salina]
MVIHGTMERHVSSMSQHLKACLQDLRTALQPSSCFTGPLPRQIRRPLEDLMALHLFLTKHQRLQSTTSSRPSAPVPKEKDRPRDPHHAAAAAGVGKKLAFRPSSGPAAPTQRNTRAYGPRAKWKQHHARLRNSVYQMCSPQRIQQAERTVRT